MTKLFFVCLQSIAAIYGIFRGTTSIAYAAQRAWLINSTLKENILFGLAARFLLLSRPFKQCGSQKMNTTKLDHRLSTENVFKCNTQPILACNVILNEIKQYIYIYP